MPARFWDHFPLRSGRAHEVTGPAASSFAAIACGLCAGPALWAVERWHNEQLNPAGLSRFCKPQNLLLALGNSQADILALSEDALRSGAVSVVVSEVHKPLSLLAGRRLQLAAEAGQSLGLIILSEEHGGNAAETRWRCAPILDPQEAFDPRDSTLQRWELIKNKTGTTGAWQVRWNEQTHRITVVSATGEPTHLARAAL